jgi:hypothetical protein
MISVKDAAPRRSTAHRAVGLNRGRYDKLKKKVIACTNQDRPADLQYGFLPTLQLEEFLKYCDFLTETIVKHCPDYETNTVRKKLPPATAEEATALKSKTFANYMAAVDEAFDIAQSLLRRLDSGEVMELDYNRIFSDAGDIIESALASVPYCKQTRIFYGPGSSSVGVDGLNHCTYKSRVGKLASLCGDLSNLELFFEEDLADQIRQTGCQSEYTWDKLHQVPKDAAKNRVITITSVLRKAEQKAIGEWIRKAYRSIKRGGMNHNLDTCARDHQVLAWIASKTGLFDTYDFSSASDRITFPIVERVLTHYKRKPNCLQLWHLMQESSSLGFEWEGQFYTYRSFPMGYVFPFEFESLFFFALTVAFLLNWGFNTNEVPLPSRVAYMVSTFGDDTIVPYARPKSSFERFYGNLGFKLNAEKSFSLESSFRESCGADFNNGVFVRGFYVKTRTPSIRDFLRITNYVKLNFNVSDLELSKNAYYKKTVSLYGLRLSSLSVTKLVNRNALFTKDVPVSVLLVDNEDTDPKFLIMYGQTHTKKEWLDCHLLFCTDYSLLANGYEECESSFSEKDADDTLRLRSVTQNDARFFEVLSERWVDDLILKYDPTLCLL